MSDILIDQPAPVSVPPPLSEENQTLLNAVYARFDVLDKDAHHKNEALQKLIQPRRFFAFGGQESIEMELRMNERIYLRTHAKRV